MKRSLAALVPVLAIAFAASCADRVSAPDPGLQHQPLASVVCAANPDWNALLAESDSVMGAGTANAATSRTRIEHLMRLCASTSPAAAQEMAVSIATFAVAKYETGELRPIVPTGSTAERETLDFINHVLAAAVVDLAYSQLDNSWIVNPQDSTTTFVTDDGAASITVSGSDVDATTLITAEELPPSPNYLQTDLDQYARYYRFTKASVDGDTSFNNPVTVAICVLTPASMPDSVFRRLRIGAQHADGFEVTPPAEPPPSLDCAEAAARLTTRALANGGSAAIIGDDGSGLVARGGVGGSADNFRPGTSARLTSQSLAPCTIVEAVKDAEVPVACRPTVSLGTAAGQTPLDGIPVTFTILTGGGLIAAEDPVDQGCGTFGTSVTVPSSASGEARICWTLGSVGANTVGAKAGHGGDASEGTWFAYAGGGQVGGNGIVFTATGLKLDAQATALGGSFSFDNLPHGGNGSCLPSSLTPVLTYSPGGSGAPVNAGSYTVTATCGGDGTDYNPVSATADITISRVGSVTTVSCPSAVPYTGAAVTPCTATVTGAGGLTTTAPITYTGNVLVGTASALALFGGGPNHTGSAGSTTFQIATAPAAIQVTCDDATYTGAPITSCTASVTGPGGSLTTLPDIAYANNTNAGTATATVAFGGDQYVAAGTGTATFTILKAPTTTTVTCTDAVYTANLVTTCQARAAGAGGLSVAVPVTYSNNRNAGHAAGSAAYAGDANHLPSTGQATFVISNLAATASAGSTTIDFGTSPSRLPCAVAGLLAPDVNVVTCHGTASYTKAGTFPVQPVVVPTVNYAITKVNGTLTVLPYSKGCPEAPLYSSPPATAAGVPKGSVVPIWCDLRNSLGSRVGNAWGDVEVRAAGASPVPGTDPLTYPLMHTAIRGMAVIPSLEYRYLMDTTPAGFVAGQYYHVIVRWNDGTITAGWFYLR